MGRRTEGSAGDLAAAPTPQPLLASADCGFMVPVEASLLGGLCAPHVGLTAKSPACYIRGHGRRCLNRLPQVALASHNIEAALPSCLTMVQLDHADVPLNAYLLPLMCA